MPIPDDQILMEAIKEVKDDVTLTLENYGVDDVTIAEVVHRLGDAHIDCRTAPRHLPARTVEGGMRDRYGACSRTGQGVPTPRRAYMVGGKLPRQMLRTHPIRAS